MNQLRDAALAIVDRYRRENSVKGGIRNYDSLIEELIDALAAPEPTLDPTASKDHYIARYATDLRDEPEPTQETDEQWVERWPAQKWEEPTHEPMAWMHDGLISTLKSRVEYDKEFRERGGFKPKPIIPLYAHPAPPQTPMTDEQAEALWEEDDTDGSDAHTLWAWKKMVRAVERHHAIGPARGE
jgi:hypothetical protein